MTLQEIFKQNPELAPLNPHLTEEADPRPRRAKYLSSPKMYNGREYHSEWEADHARDLDLEKRAGEIIGVVAQFPVPLRDGTIMIVDFLVVQKDWTCRLDECKSDKTKTAIYRHKRKEFKALYPGVEYREIVKPAWKR